MLDSVQLPSAGARVQANPSPPVFWSFLISIVLIHTTALLACFPWFFSWTGVIAAIAGLYVFGTLGINLCYHRLLTHQAFRCPKWLEHSFAVLGVCCLQHTPARWVVVHRLHHQHSDQPSDPHSPVVAFFWGHIGWLLVENRELGQLSTYERYARDILRDPFYIRLERKLLWFWIYVGHLAVLFAAGGIAGWLTTGTASGALQLASSVLVWGGLLRTVLVWHITWSVNSVTHVWGYQTYATDENSRNNWFIALISNGEGWHNNHHADQRSVAHGHQWWELDVTYLTIRCLALLGLANDLIPIRSRTAAPTLRIAPIVPDGPVVELQKRAA